MIGMMRAKAERDAGHDDHFGPPPEKNTSGTTLFWEILV